LRKKDGFPYLFAAADAEDSTHPMRRLQLETFHTEKGIFYLAQVCDRFQRIALSLALSWLSSPSSCLPSSPFATEHRSHSAAAQNRMMRERERDSVVPKTTTTTAAKIEEKRR
jgi:hypothetical protein